ncbi:Pyridoxal-5'-phosphate-dependent protein beta subunit [Anaeromyxobacter dehalogenans 2CP-1]|uniref:Pyridoxal-5'-phosphate-dependent protein beta subunit n=1 Tax=Anaeromyxobacter dehalogenans (strain ATCC BAA-258 / DSM 21875 / 2CP-1) TaxID=455488 RepID=B8J5B0_ANAD2|nr:cystathionine beta-synthase [Anaeromyxobacter dehalogenans]ACL66772.1 Pyridoxal-5'-phosphate-dependent protein beta subunit [Anaeromyxobacter dehalogenans 2CP-1]
MPLPPPPPAAGALELIGATPMVRVRHLDTGPCELFLKLESANPGGSIKDRIGLSMIAAAERDGSLGGDRRHLVEATAGNTGLGLALVAAQRGYRLTLVIPDKMSREKILHLKALGAEVVMTRSDVGKGHPEYYQDQAERIAREEGAFYVNQFANPANPAAHEAGTGPELVAQLGGRLDAMVCGVGSGGTLTGLSRHLAKAVPGCEMVLADPEGSVLAGYVETGTIGKAGSWLVEGIGEDFLPPVADLSRVRRAHRIPDRESLETARALLRAEGILAGSSTGTLLAAALRHCRAADRPLRVCTLVCDSGNKYLSKMFDDLWMLEQGLSDRPTVGDLTDLVTRRFADRAVVTAGPGDPLLVALNRMKANDVSQLPVVEDGRVVGIVDESDLLLAAVDDPSRLSLPVRDVMTTRLETVTPATPFQALLPMFAAGLVPIVMDAGRFVGLVTRMDVLGALRRRVAR